MCAQERERERGTCVFILLALSLVVDCSFMADEPCPSCHFYFFTFLFSLGCEYVFRLCRRELGSLLLLLLLLWIYIYIYMCICTLSVIHSYIACLTADHLPFFPTYQSTPVRRSVSLEAMAPAKKGEKKPAAKTVKKDGKKKVKKSTESYKIYIYKVLKQVGRS